jgi:hypothetical protein
MKGARINERTAFKGSGSDLRFIDIVHCVFKRATDYPNGHG